MIVVVSVVVVVVVQITTTIAAIIIIVVVVRHGVVVVIIVRMSLLGVSNEVVFSPEFLGTKVADEWSLSRVNHHMTFNVLASEKRTLTPLALEFAF